MQRNTLIRDLQLEAAERALLEAEIQEEPDFSREDYQHLAYKCEENGDLVHTGTRLEKRGTSSQAELWQRNTHHKLSIAAKLREAGRASLAEPLEKCHTEDTLKVCNGCSGVTVFSNRCDLFYCPQCSPRLARDRRQGVQWWTQRIKEPKHVVLTVRNSERLTKEHVQWFKQCFAKLRRRKVCRAWRGGFYRLEVTNESRGWHLHMHALVDVGWINTKALHDEWAGIVGQDLVIFKVKDVHGRDYLSEVTKYAVKGSQMAGWTGAQMIEFIDAFKGVKTFGVFGDLFGARTEFKEYLKTVQTDKAKCTCGCENFRFFSPNEYQWHLLQVEARSGHAAGPPSPTTPDLPNLPNVEGRPPQHDFYRD